MQHLSYICSADNFDGVVESLAGNFELLAC